MKWPNTLTVVRHGESAYQELVKKKKENDLYLEFLDAFNERKEKPEKARTLAQAIIDSELFSMGGVGEHLTPLTEHGRLQARQTGAALAGRITLPNVVMLSPYPRVKDTFAEMCEGWPELGEVKVKEDERLREQDHGLAVLYNDWRIFHTIHPEQAALWDMYGRYWYRYPQGENVPDVRERTRSITTSIARDYHGREVLMVSHHLQMLALRSNLENLDAAGYEYLDEHEKPINCGTTIYRGYPDLGEDGKLLLDVYNEKLYAC